MTSHLDSAYAASACSCAPSLRAMRGQHAATTGARYPSVATGAVPTVAENGLAKHSQKRFPMTAINVNVWPLSPEEWSSG